MKKTCSNTYCSNSFEWSDEDARLFAKFDIDIEPTICPTCRHQQRGLFKSGIIFYKRSSDFSGRPLISIFPSDAPFPVYSTHEWWSESWDATSFGLQREYDKSLFEQLSELSSQVPRQSCFSTRTENSEFNAGCSDAKNIYYSITVHRSEDIYYSEHVTAYCNMVCDCLRCFRSQYLYECINCSDCHYSSWCIDCNNSRDCHFSIDCLGCNDCLFCSNLRHKQQHVFNKPVSKTEYNKILQQTIDGRISTLTQNLKHFANVKNTALYKNLNNNQAESCLGDGLLNCSNCHACYNCRNSIGCRYCISLTPSEQSIDFMDVTSGGIGELVYNSSSIGGGNYFLRMCANCRESSGLTYCIDCFSCKDCFGCVGLKSKQYCILNKQYSKYEYEELSGEIVAQMKQERTFGSFFPASFSPFSYNNSFAHQLYPLSKQHALSCGFRWEESTEKTSKSTIPQTELPDSISEVDEKCLRSELICLKTGRPFKITAQELRFYKLLNIPIPRLHPDERIKQRRAQLNPPELWQRSCNQCKNLIQSSFSPTDKRHIYCEKCYLDNVIN